MRGKSSPVPILQTIEVTRGRALTCRAYRENERNAVVFGRSLHISTNGRHRVPPLIGPVFPPGVVADRSETVPALADIPRQAREQFEPAVVDLVVAASMPDQHDGLSVGGGTDLVDPIDECPSEVLASSYTSRGMEDKAATDPSRKTAIIGPQTQHVFRLGSKTGLHEEYAYHQRRPNSPCLEFSHRVLE